MVSTETVPVLTTIPVPAPTAKPEELVPRPELVARRIEAPPEAAWSPPVEVGLKAIELPEMVIPLPAVYSPAAENCVQVTPPVTLVTI